ncbi:hypothetical protein HanHA300_Chr06g0200671 [Helianthus annuus]|nr:hypothetical protein HanHA300_Chr06g0200671 [Helianthus annuus]KAJ0739807.1 hypothetical protein HanOQP8_Chr06g0209781 [Helianthus annuus]
MGDRQRVFHVVISALCITCKYRFESVYLDEEIRIVKDIRGDYLVVDRAPYSWTE